MCITKVCEEPTTQGVWWRDDAEWRQYDAAQAATIQRAIRDGAKCVRLGNLASSNYSARGGAGYEVDLITMKQRNLATGYARDVKIVKGNAPAPGNSLNSSEDPVATLIDELRACREVMQSLKQKVEKLEADFLAFKVNSAPTSAITKAPLRDKHGAGYNEYDREGSNITHVQGCGSILSSWPTNESLSEYSTDFSYDDDY